MISSLNRLESSLGEIWVKITSGEIGKGFSLLSEEDREILDHFLNVSKKREITILVKISFDKNHNKKYVVEIPE